MTDPTPDALTARLELHICRICGTRWLRWPDGWNLLDSEQRPEACCDNVKMGEQIALLRTFDLPHAARLDAVLELLRQEKVKSERLTQERDEAEARGRAAVLHRVLQFVLADCYKLAQAKPPAPETET